MGWRPRSPERSLQMPSPPAAALSHTSRSPRRPPGGLQGHSLDQPDAGGPVTSAESSSCPLSAGDHQDEDALPPRGPDPLRSHAHCIP